MTWGYNLEHFMTVAYDCGVVYGCSLWLQPMVLLLASVYG
jgi:hypothetical protein